MGQVGKFLNEVCASHPQLMAAVLERPFSRLSEWIDWDAEGGPCGCVIGTMALAAGVAESEGTRAACGFLSPILRRNEPDIMAIGMRVHEISVRLTYGTLNVESVDAHRLSDSDRLVSQMIRTRIARELVIQESNALGAVEMLV